VRSGSAHLGVTIDPISSDVRNQFNIPADVRGAVVTAVEPGSVADKLGIQVGDVVRRFDNKDLNSSDDLSNMMLGRKWGDTKEIKFSRYDKNHVAKTVEAQVHFN